MLLSVARFSAQMASVGRGLRRQELRAYDGARLAAWVGGAPNGRPVIFLHGFCSGNASMRPLAGAVSDTRKIVLYDARGHGRSAGFGEHATIGQLADDLSAVMDHVAPQGADLVGLSMGAQTIFEYLRAHGGDRIGRMVFIDQSPKIVADERWPHGLFGQVDEELLIRVRRDLQDRPRRLGRAWLRGMWRSDETLPIKLLLSPGMAAGLPGISARTLQLAADMLTQDWRDVVAAIVSPVLLLYGGRSIYPGAGEWMKRTLPHAELVWFARSGHALIVEEPNRAAAALRAFLMR